MKLPELLSKMKENNVAKAYFADDDWYVIRCQSFIRYCNKDGSEVGETIRLTFSNMNAEYIIVSK